MARAKKKTDTVNNTDVTVESKVENKAIVDKKPIDEVSLIFETSDLLRSGNESTTLECDEYDSMACPDGVPTDTEPYVNRIFRRLIPVVSLIPFTDREVNTKPTYSLSVNGLVPRSKLPETDDRVPFLHLNTPFILSYASNPFGLMGSHLFTNSYNGGYFLSMFRRQNERKMATLFGDIIQRIDISNEDSRVAFLKETLFPGADKLTVKEVIIDGLTYFEVKSSPIKVEIENMPDANHHVSITALLKTNLSLLGRLSSNLYSQLSLNIENIDIVYHSDKGDSFTINCNPLEKYRDYFYCDYDSIHDRIMHDVWSELHYKFLERGVGVNINTLPKTVKVLDTVTSYLLIIMMFDDLIYSLFNVGPAVFNEANLVTGIHTVLKPKETTSIDTITKAPYEDTPIDYQVDFHLFTSLYRTCFSPSENKTYFRHFDRKVSYDFGFPRYSDRYLELIDRLNDVSMIDYRKLMYIPITLTKVNQVTRKSMMMRIDLEDIFRVMESIFDIKSDGCMVSSNLPEDALMFAYFRSLYTIHALPEIYNITPNNLHYETALLPGLLAFMSNDEALSKVANEVNRTGTEDGLITYIDNPETGEGSFETYFRRPIGLSDEVDD